MAAAGRGVPCRAWILAYRFRLVCSCSALTRVFFVLLLLLHAVFGGDMAVSGRAWFGLLSLFCLLAFAGFACCVLAVLL